MQQQIRDSTGYMALYYAQGHSNTTRSKSYKKGCQQIDCGPLNQILQIDPEQKKVHVEPRVTMDALVKATLPYGLIPPVVPEFKGITVGGAINGAAAESTSHAWGIFHDTCTQIEMIDGKGEGITASPTHNPDLFYGISGSYGSLGLLTGAELQLMPAQPTVLLRYYPFRDPHEALQHIESLTGQVDFLDGIIFSAEHTVVMAGTMISEAPSRLSKQWFAARASVCRSYHEEKIPLYEYLFRYDEGAFWMGSFLFSTSFLRRYISQGLFHRKAPQSYFNAEEVARFKQLPFPGCLSRTLTRPLMNSQRLWWLLHRSEKWVQDRLVIQDCSIPTAQALTFLSTILKDPQLFPIWLCPLKGTQTPQHLAPHQGKSSFLNFGLYGVSAHALPMSEIISTLEELTQACGGRKVLYSRSYYSEEAFWNIYPKPFYDQLRHKMHAPGKWRDLTEKVLSE